MHPRVTGLLPLVILLGALSACAERQSPFEPIAIRPPSRVVLLPSVSNQVLTLAGPLDPARTLTLPRYAEKVIVEFRLDGVIFVKSLHPHKTSVTVDGSGYWRSDGWEACYVNVIFRYSLGSWGPGPCHTSPPQPLRIDTVLVQGDGTVKRGGAVAQWSWECPGADRCWGYEGEQTFSVTPTFAAINLTALGRPELAPGVIELPGPVYTTFKTGSTPVSFKNIPVPIRVLSWQWIAAAGGSGQTYFTGFPTDVQRTVYLAEPGSMIVTAFVNGVEQVDTIRVVGRDVKIAVEQARMKFSIEVPDLPGYVQRHDTSRQVVTVSVLRDNAPVPNAIVDLTLTARESTGGHLHVGGKPRGSLNLTQVNTGSTGMAKVIYTAPQVTGPVTIKGTSANAKADSAIADVGIDLVEFGSGVGYELVGGDTYGGTHPKNHFVTASHLAALQTLITTFRAKFASTVLKFNDSSLESGGLFDFNIPTAPWVPGHQGHREGKHTDLHTKPPSGQTGPDLTSDEKDLIKHVWEALGGEPRRHKAPSYHFHLVHP